MFYLLLLLGCSAVCAQESGEEAEKSLVKPVALSIELGAGRGSKPRDPLFVPHLACRFQRGNWLYSFFTSHGETFDDDDFTDKYSESGMMVGVARGGRWGGISGSMGISRYTSVTRGRYNSSTDEYEGETKQGWGIPLELKAVVNPLKFFGLGVRLYGNPTSGSSGYSFFLQLRASF